MARRRKDEAPEAGGSEAQQDDEAPEAGDDPGHFFSTTDCSFGIDGGSFGEAPSEG